MRLRAPWVVLLLGLLAASPAWGSAPHAALEDLAAELRGAGGPGGAMGLYARAFAGYALVNAGREDLAYAGRAAALLDGLIERVTGPDMAAPFHAGSVSVAGRRLSASVAQRGHLALMLVGRRGLSPLSPAQRALLAGLVSGLAAELRDRPAHLLPTYGHRTWPADNEVAAAALALYLTEGPDIHVGEGLHRLQAALAQLERDGLPPSEVSASGPPRAHDVPRGCALSWTVAMRGLYDPARARALYARYREAFWAGLGPVVGFREWPRGVSRSADADSGPIVLGIGTAASGIGIGAARLAGADDDHQALLRAAALAGLPAMDREDRRKGRHLERAISLWARSARPWLPGT